MMRDQLDATAEREELWTVHQGGGQTRWILSQQVLSDALRLSNVQIESLVQVRCTLVALTRSFRLRFVCVLLSGRV